SSGGQIRAEGLPGSLASVTVRVPGSLTPSGQDLTETVTVQVDPVVVTQPPAPGPTPISTPAPTPSPAPGRKLYVANQTGNTLSVIDTSTNLVTATLTTLAAANPR